LNVIIGMDFANGSFSRQSYSRMKYVPIPEDLEGWINTLLEIRDDLEDEIKQRLNERMYGFMEMKNSFEKYIEEYLEKHERFYPSFKDLGIYISEIKQSEKEIQEEAVGKLVEEFYQKLLDLTAMLFKRLKNRLPRNSITKYWPNQYKTLIDVKTRSCTTYNYSKEFGFNIRVCMDMWYIKNAERILNNEKLLSILDKLHFPLKKHDY